MRTSLTLLAAAATVASASAQSTIYGIDVRLQRFFTTDTAQFVNNFTQIAANASPIFALDFDASATTLWAVNNTTNERGTFDLTTGIFSSAGVLTLPSGIAGATGLTSTPGGTWYLSQFNATTGESVLFQGDITTGVFTTVGVIGGTLAVPNIVIDISASNTGAIYAHSISTDTIMSVDTTTGLGTDLGPTGFAANFAQGMDFDWTNNTLYITIYTGGGTGGFGTVNLTTGAVTQLEDTLVLNAEMEIAIQNGVGGTIGTPFCVVNPNSTGNAGVMTAVGSTVAANNSVTLLASNLPNSQFGFFLNSLTQGFVPNPNNSQGNLCLGGAIGRYNAAGQLFNTGGTGSGSLALNLPNTPTPTGPTAIVAGQTWNFQCWYRDLNPAPTSNFTNGLTIAFQ